MSLFLCPNCRTPHLHLRDILQCCPAALRALTHELEHGPACGVSLVGLLSGRTTPALMRRALARLDGDTGQEA